MLHSAVYPNAVVVAVDLHSLQALRSGVCTQRRQNFSVDAWLRSLE